MNILPKKSWHVRTKRNIERVRRDEAKAAEEEKELKRRIKLAEQEARTAFLRKKAKLCAPQTELAPVLADAKEEESTDDREHHVNFFKEIENAGRYLGGTNKEHEEEKKAEQETFEKNIGALTYLGQSSIEATGVKPWYLESPSKQYTQDSEEKRDIKSEKRKKFLDPINDVQHYLELSYGKKSKKEEKSKHHSWKKGAAAKPKKTVEDLRAERLKRERSERERAEQLLKKLKGGPSKEVVVDERQQRYNSQFNPHLARQNQPP